MGINSYFYKEGNPQEEDHPYQWSNAPLIKGGYVQQSPLYSTSPEKISPTRQAYENDVTQILFDRNYLSLRAVMKERISPRNKLMD